MYIDKFDRIISTTIIIDSWKSSFIIFLYSAQKRCLSLTAGEKFAFFFFLFFFFKIHRNIAAQHEPSVTSSLSTA